MRRDFRLPEADEAWLNGRGLPWETVVDRDQRWLVVHDWPLPAGFNQTSVVVGVMIPAAYPDAGLDMVYLRPAIARVDGRSIPAVTAHQALGQTWQRWSRHYTPQNPWRNGEDDVSTHLTLTEYWLKRELVKDAT